MRTIGSVASLRKPASVFVALNQIGMGAPLLMMAGKLIMSEPLLKPDSDSANLMKDLSKALPMLTQRVVPSSTPVSVVVGHNGAVASVVPPFLSEELTA